MVSPSWFVPVRLATAYARQIKRTIPATRSSAWEAGLDRSPKSIVLRRSALRWTNDVPIKPLKHRRYRYADYHRWCNGHLPATPDDI